MNIGPNWKTTLSGIGAAIFSLLTVLAALPYESGEIAQIFPVAWKPKILIVSAIAALILKVWNSMVQKDRNVTGGDVQQDLDGNYAAKGTQTLVDVTKASTPQHPPTGLPGSTH